MIRYLLIFITFNVFSQDTLINMKFFKILYSIDKKCPKEVYYRAHNDKCCSRIGKDFYTNNRIQTSTDIDYLHNVYDKGHLVPAASMSFSCEALDSTFSYLNCSLQHFKLNRGFWANLEWYERVLVSIGYEVDVTAGTLHINGTQKSRSGAQIPTHFYKIIRYVDETEVYLFENDECSGHFNDYRTKLEFLNFLKQQSK